MSDFSVYKKLELGRILSNSAISNAAGPIAQSHTRTEHHPIANFSAALAESPVMISKYAANVVSAQVTFSASFVSNATDYNVVTVSKRTGNGAAVVVATTNFASTAGTSFTPTTITLSTNAANTQLAAGDMVTCTIAKTGNGVANTPTAAIDIVLEDV